MFCSESEWCQKNAAFSCIFKETQPVNFEVSFGVKLSRVEHQGNYLKYACHWILRLPPIKNHWFQDLKKSGGQ